MRRFQLCCVVFLMMMLASPAMGRTFRTDLSNCGGTLGGLSVLQERSPEVQFCWGNISPLIGLRVELPTDQGTSYTTFGGTVTGGVLGFRHAQPNSSFNFIVQAFDYGQFLRDIGNPTGQGLTPPRIETSLECGFVTCDNVTGVRGLARVDDPSGTGPFDIPVLRVNWFLDPDIPVLYPAFANIFEPSEGFINGIEYFGVQLIFYGDGTQDFADPSVNGVAFELNGLRDYRYSLSTLWTGSEEPCGVFNISGRPLCQGPSNNVPEPPSHALLALGLLALAFRRWKK